MNDQICPDCGQNHPSFDAETVNAIMEDFFDRLDEVHAGNDDHIVLDKASSMIIGFFLSRYVMMVQRAETSKYN